VKSFTCATSSRGDSGNRACEGSDRMSSQFITSQAEVWRPVDRPRGALFGKPDPVSERDGVPGLIAWHVSGRSIANLQQCLPNLPYDAGRRQPARSEPAQHPRTESGIAAALQLFRCDEGRGFVWDEEKLERFMHIL